MPGREFWSAVSQCHAFILNGPEGFAAILIQRKKKEPEGSFVQSLMDLAGFEKACRAHAATNTHADNTVLLITPLQLANQVTR